MAGLLGLEAVRGASSKLGVSRKGHNCRETPSVVSQSCVDGSPNSDQEAAIYAERLLTR